MRVAHIESDQFGGQSPVTGAGAGKAVPERLPAPARTAA
ncbi:hypothetical protein M2302_003808 [Micromonospora sp. A200]|nr:hypothetical protein [Micromonospora sp. A200]